MSLYCPFLKISQKLYCLSSVISVYLIIFEEIFRMNVLLDFTLCLEMVCMFTTAVIIPYHFKFIIAIDILLYLFCMIINNEFDLYFI